MAEVNFPQIKSPFGSPTKKPSNYGFQSPGQSSGICSRSSTRQGFFSAISGQAKSSKKMSQEIIEEKPKVQLKKNFNSQSQTVLSSKIINHRNHPQPRNIILKKKEIES